MKTLIFGGYSLTEYQPKKERELKFHHLKNYKTIELSFTRNV